MKTYIEGKKTLIEQAEEKQASMEGFIPTSRIQPGHPIGMEMYDDITYYHHAVHTGECKE